MVGNVIMNVPHSGQLQGHVSNQAFHAVFKNMKVLLNQVGYFFVFLKEHVFLYSKVAPFQHHNWHDYFWRLYANGWRALSVRLRT
jgi:phosphatidylethanolamine-binding protein (PEBP) family uncharacterized protein